ncbi:XRE family transcriptional regulator [Pseudophaeobacter sp.]|jgi:predicted transcriptional regulator|uniref:helix-turn-helix domain-containing protein n=1 Tax=Pseudophaeobacter sp. TaxID=1971739 RepID=UPI0032D97ACB
MEQFLKEIRAYAARFGVSPSTVIQKAGVSGGKWRRWVDGTSSPTLHTVDRLRAYMAENPPAADQAEDVA